MAEPTLDGLVELAHKLEIAASEFGENLKKVESAKREGSILTRAIATQLHKEMLQDVDIRGTNQDIRELASTLGTFLSRAQSDFSKLNLSMSQVLKFKSFLEFAKSKNVIPMLNEPRHVPHEVKFSLGSKSMPCTDC